METIFSEKAIVKSKKAGMGVTF